MLLGLVLAFILILIVDVCICSMRSVNKTVFKPSTTVFIFGINILQVMFFYLDLKSRPLCWRHDSVLCRAILILSIDFRLFSQSLACFSTNQTAVKLTFTSTTSSHDIQFPDVLRNVCIVRTKISVEHNFKQMLVHQCSVWVHIERLLWHRSMMGP